MDVGMKPSAWPVRLLVIAVALALGLGGGVAHAARHGGGSPRGGFPGHGGWHGGMHGRHGGGPHIFVDGGFFFGSPFYWGNDPFLYDDPYYDPYPPAAYAYPDYYPPEEPEIEASPPEEEPSGTSQPEASNEGSRASYGLVQLRGVPDGASVALDGRFWLTANGLEQRWLAMPDGEHTVAVRVRGADPVERRIDVKAGKPNVVRFGPFPRVGG